MDGQDFLKHCYSRPSRLEDLPIGAHFICFPYDGDDSGHGGFKKGSYLMTKIEPYHPGEGYHESYRKTYVQYGKDIYDEKNHNDLPLRTFVTQVHF